MEQRKRKENHLSEGCSGQLASEEREERNTQTKKQKKQTNKQIKGTDKQTNKRNTETNKYCNEKKKITSARVAAANEQARKRARSHADMSQPGIR